MPNVFVQNLKTTNSSLHNLNLELMSPHDQYSSNLMKESVLPSALTSNLEKWIDNNINKEIPKEKNISSSNTFNNLQEILANKPLPPKIDSGMKDSHLSCKNMNNINNINDITKLFSSKSSKPLTTPNINSDLVINTVSNEPPKTKKFSFKSK